MSPFNALPLGLTRLVLLSLLTIFAIVSCALCLKIVTKHNSVQNLINANVPSGVSVDFQYRDVKITTILLFVAANFVTLTTSHIVLALIEDAYHLMPPALARRLKIADKCLSTSTLAYQAGALVFSTVCVVLSLGFMTSFVFNRDATILVKSGGMKVPESTVQGVLQRLGIAMAYRDTPYILIAAELSWVVVFLAVPTILVTLVAWYKSSRDISRSPTVVDVLALDEKQKYEGEKVGVVQASRSSGSVV